MRVCSIGLVRPYDPVIMAQKVADAKRSYPHLDLSQIEGCCPHSTEIRDVGDLKPYILAAAKEVAMELEMNMSDFEEKRTWKNR